MDFYNYVEEMPCANFEPTGLTKETYLELIELCLEAYPQELILSMNAKEDIQAYSRIVCSFALLVSEGRRDADFALEIMSHACDAIEDNKGDMKLDFAVKEIMIAYMLLEKYAPADLKAQWDNCLKVIAPKEFYRCSSGDNHNINIYNLSGEWLRIKYGISDDISYIEECLEKQVVKFDKFGMYPDNLAHDPRRNPMLYDLTTRVQLQLMTGFGYDGKYRQILDEIMEKGGLTTLFTQSAAFELPYGGRSNQYLFNESLIASCCEYEAVRQKAKGNMKLAGAYKRAAHLAVMSIDRWLKAKKHIKNMYESDLIGTESYGYYSKYMVTMASFMAIGCLFVDDTIPEQPCPAEVGGYIIETTDRFNKIFANCGGYSIEIDTDADFHYDCTGLGRIHKAGVPTELALSVPCTKHPGYTLPDGCDNENLSIGVGFKNDNGDITYVSDLSDIDHTTTVLKQDKEEVKFKVQYTGAEFPAICETYTLTSRGLKLEAEVKDAPQVFVRVPLLVSTGDKQQAVTTSIEAGADQVKCSAMGHSYNVKTDGSLSVSGKRRGNRNGVYTYADINKSGSKITLDIALD